MRKCPIALAVMMALILPGSTAYAGGGHGSIARLKTLQAARNRALSFQKQQLKKDEASLKDENNTEASPKTRKAKAPKDVIIPGFGSKADREAVAAVDRAYQAAVKTNNTHILRRILGNQVNIVLGNGRVVTREAILTEAMSNTVHYAKQDEVPGTKSVRVFGDMAVVTALLWVKGEGIQGQFDDHLWFSSTYLRTPKGWTYYFGQVSLPLSPDDVDQAVKEAQLATKALLAAEKAADPGGPYAQGSPYGQSGQDSQAYQYGQTSQSSQTSQYGQNGQYNPSDQYGTNQYGTGDQTDQGYLSDQTSQDGQDNQDNQDSQNTDTPSPYR